jgi:Regulator of chromosome condensation (RCC1) repeat
VRVVALPGDHVEVHLAPRLDAEGIVDEAGDDPLAKDLTRQLVGRTVGNDWRSRYVAAATALLVLVGILGFVGVGPGGADSAHVASASNVFTSLTPSRILDTRSGTGAAKAAVASKGTVALTVDGAGGVPASGVAAVVVNITVTQPQAAGYVTVFPDGTTRPNASNLNFSAGETIPNLVVALVGGDGKVDLYNGSGGTVQLVADVSGWFAGPTGTLHGVVSVVGDPNASTFCGLLASGGVDCWGDNSSGQLGNGLPLNSVSGGTCNNGTNRCAVAPTPVVAGGGSSNLTGVANVSLGGDTSAAGDGASGCAVLSNGGLDCWGENDLGERRLLGSCRFARPGHQFSRTFPRTSLVAAFRSPQVPSRHLPSPHGKDT